MEVGGEWEAGEGMGREAGFPRWWETGEITSAAFYNGNSRKRGGPARKGQELGVKGMGSGKLRPPHHHHHSGRLRWNMMCHL